MIVLPIRNYDKNKKGRIMNVEVKLKTAKKQRSRARLVNVDESEIISNGRKLSESSYNAKRQSPNLVVDFIRNTSLISNEDYLLTTREASNSTTYDVYSIKHPCQKVSDGLDNLYGEVITNMRIEIPDQKKPKYISLKELGVDQELTDEKFIKLQNIVKNYPKSSWAKLFKEAGIESLEKAIEFVNTFDCTVINNSTIPENDLESMIKSFERFNGSEGKKLKSYYNKAIENEEVYAKLTLINKILNNEPLRLIKTEKNTNEKEYQYVKKDDRKVA